MDVKQSIRGKVNLSSVRHFRENVDRTPYSGYGYENDTGNDTGILNCLFFLGFS
jgi:hypothetical protein